MPLIILAMSLIALLSMGCAKGAEKPPGQNPSQVEQTPGKQPSDNNKPSENVQKPGQYFPLVKGTVWEYQGEGNEYATFNREVLFNRDNRAQIKEDNGGTVMAMIFETTDDAVTRVFRQGEVYEKTNLLDKPSNEKLIILKTPLKKGTQWKDSSGDREIVDVNATVETPAGKFEKCIKVKIAGQDSTLYEYYKDGVGMVKREFISGDSTITSTLKKYVPGKS